LAGVQVNERTFEYNGQPDLPVPSEWDDFATSASEADSAVETDSTALVIGIIGDSGSGKKTVADGVEALLGADRVTDILLDDYYRYTRAERAEMGLTPSTPLVHDLALMEEHLRTLRRRRSISMRSYDHSDGTFGPIRTIEGRDIVVIHGLMGFPTPELKSLYDLAVFLMPEPDLLFRWKLRRDVLFRGYTEAEVLKRIASHLLDAKEFVVPQADLADVVVEYKLPHVDAPDVDVVTTIRFRGATAALARESGLIEGLQLESEADASDLVLTIPADLPTETLDRWAATRFGATYRPEASGLYFDETGVVQRRASLAALELIIADLGMMLRTDLKRRCEPEG